MRRIAPLLAVGVTTAAVLATLITTQAGSASAAPDAPVTPSPASAASSPVTTTANYTPPPIAWAKCKAASLRAIKAQCGYLTVPLDYADPGGTKIKLAMSRVRHTVKKSKYQGIMLANPGGPGGPGRDLAGYAGYVPKKAGYAYDWIGFDPRGVGASKPSLNCYPKYFRYDRPNYVPFDSADEAAWLKRSESYAKYCAKHGGDLLDHVKTVDTVRDMESMRKALGRKQINFYGYSYGTYLGEVYATFYPERVRRMVLDGVIDPGTVWYQANLDQDTAIDHNLDVYFRWVARYNKVYKLGTSATTIKKRFYDELGKLDAKPAGGKIGPDELSDVMVAAGYGTFDWPLLTEAYSTLLKKGNYKPVKALYDESNPQTKAGENFFAMYNATQCTDAPWPTDYGSWKADAWKIFDKTPFLAWNNTWYNAPCLFWPAAPGTPVQVDGSKAPKILLINETYDGATPFSGALTTRSLFPKSVLIEGLNGTTHAASLSGIPCTDNKVADYLAAGKLPARKAGNRSDVHCRPIPQPVPTKG